MFVNLSDREGNFLIKWLSIYSSHKFSMIIRGSIKYLLKDLSVKDREICFSAYCDVIINFKFINC